MDAFLRDLRYGLRSLRRAPGFTWAAVLALGLGTGATTAIFSLVDGIVLRPLPYAEPERLVMIWDTNHAKSLEHEPLSPVNFIVDYRNLTQVFTDAAAWWRPDINLTDEQNEPVRVNTIEVSGNLFSVLGVQPQQGRGFAAAPDGALHSAEREVVISHRLWRTRFNADPTLVGRPLRLNGRLFTVVGVMPPGFGFPGQTDIWQRLMWPLAQHTRAAHFMEAVGRLRPGATVDQANNELRSVTERLQREFAATNTGWGARVVPLHHEVVGFFRPALFALLGAVGLLLLIACTNVANLLLARATSREREVAIRSAIGASRGRLVRQLLTESLVLALLGGALGVAVAFAGLKILIAATPLEIPRLDQVAIDTRALAFAGGVALITSLVFGLVPALFTSAADLQRMLKEGGKGSSAGAAGRRAQGLLVGAEVALAVMLLVVAGLLTRSFAELLKEDPGFNPTRVLTASVQLPVSSYADWGQVERFYSNLATSIRSHPAVAAAGSSNFLPLAAGWRLPFLVQGRSRPKAGDEPTAQHHSVDEGYFGAIGLPVLTGRSFSDRDTTTTGGVVIINQTLARQYFPNEDPVGKTIVSFARAIGPLGRSLMKAREHQIVGVVGGMKNNSLQNQVEPAIYHTQRQFPFRSMNLVVRGSGDVASLNAVIRDSVRRLDPGLPISDVRPMDRVLAESTERPQFLMFLMGGFALMALLLAALGIYGVLSYAVGQRRHEISIRMALGAEPGAVLWLIVREGLKVTLIGGALGVAGALAVGRSLSSLLYGIRATDALTFGAVLAIVLAVALLACLIPARRASTFNPIVGLRAE